MASPSSTRTSPPSAWTFLARVGRPEALDGGRSRWQPQLEAAGYQSRSESRVPCSCACSPSVESLSGRRATPSASPPRRATPPRSSSSPPGSRPQRPARRPRQARRGARAAPGARADPRHRGDVNFAANLPELVRCALALRRCGRCAAASWTASSRFTPLHEHALCAARAQLAEAAGEHAGPHTLRRGGGRWQAFGKVPEHAYALLGHGRCSSASRSAAKVPLATARSCSSSWATSPRSRETDALLAEDEAAAM